MFSAGTLSGFFPTQTQLLQYPQAYRPSFMATSIAPLSRANCLSQQFRLTAIPNCFNKADNDSESSDSRNQPGCIVADGPLLRQRFLVYSYDITPSGSASIEAFINYQQETFLNRFKYAGILEDGFGTTPEMMEQKLKWATIKTLIVVNQYPSWGDAVWVNCQLSEWKEERNIGIRSYWEMYDPETGACIGIAASYLMLLDTEGKFKNPDKILAELEPILSNAKGYGDVPALYQRELSDLRGQLVKKQDVQWQDMDISQNNGSYIRWILKDIPQEIQERYDLINVHMEYKEECQTDDKLISVLFRTTPQTDDEIEFEHFVFRNDGQRDEVLGAKVVWKRRT